MSTAHTHTHTQSAKSAHTTFFFVTDPAHGRVDT
jgi:hypothetical protein